jgi:hypothetical protein
MLGHHQATPRPAQLAERLDGFWSGLKAVFAHGILNR